MPVKKSAIKAMKQANAARERNRAVKVDFRSKVKAVKKAATEGTKDVETLTAQAVASIDKAAKRGVIHKSAADRRKSRLMLFLNKTVGKVVEPKTTKVKSEKPKAAKPKTAEKTTTKPKTTTKKTSTKKAS